MLFWIFVVVVILVGIIAYNVDYLTPVATAVGSSVIAAVVLAVVFVIVAFNIDMNKYMDEEYANTYSLRALQTDSSISGRSFFLSGGYIEGYRTLNYIAESDGVNWVRDARADLSFIYEDTQEEPYVDIKHFDVNVWWFAPWPIDSVNNYYFHIPEGSILESTTIDNG